MKLDADEDLDPHHNIYIYMRIETLENPRAFLKSCALQCQYVEHVDPVRSAEAQVAQGT